MHNLLVVGGNGFVGSAVCRAALARGWKVTSISPSGRPFTTPKGHVPEWTSKVAWCAADAFDPPSYAPLLIGRTAVVNTIGTLLPGAKYKAELSKGNVPGALRAIAAARAGHPDPLDERGSYAALNRDVALRLAETFKHTSQDAPASVEEATNAPGRKVFVYMSAEDVSRPVIPKGYIEMKREAERGISEIFQDRPDIRSVFIRPSMIYHAHYRPINTAISVMLDASASLHSALPSSVPTPASVLRALSGSSSKPKKDGIGEMETSALDAMANMLTTRPVHVDHVAGAIIASLASDKIEGVVDTPRIRELVGWGDASKSEPVHN